MAMAGKNEIDKNRKLNTMKLNKMFHWSLSGAEERFTGVTWSYDCEIQIEGFLCLKILRNVRTDRVNLKPFQSLIENINSLTTSLSKFLEAYSELEASPFYLSKDYFLIKTAQKSKLESDF